MYKRNIKNELSKAIKRSPVVLLIGPRQAGKTTLALEFIKENFSYETFDDELTYLSAKENMQGFISQLNKPVILDEIQRIPEIFKAIKRDVDLNRVNGKFILTGSANPLLLPKLGDSLVGRMEIVKLYPLSQGELQGTVENFIDVIFSDQQLQASQTKITVEDFYKKILTGGYPLMQNLNEEDQEKWMESYLSLMLQRDVKELAQIEKIKEIPKILKIVAGRVGNLLNVAELSRSSEMISMTTHRYLALLEALFIVNLQPAWAANLSRRFIKSPKVYLSDTGFLTYLLGINLERALNDRGLMGGIVENFVVQELRKQATWNKTKVEFFHYRTQDNKEVDIVLEDRAGNIVGIEIKNSETVTSADFRGLRDLKEKVGKKFVKGIILYIGSKYVPFDEDLFILPISSLWTN